MKNILLPFIEKKRENYKRFKHKSFEELIGRREAFLELLHV